MNIALISINVKLSGEDEGIDRSPCLAELLCQRGHNVDLITSSFQHWLKQFRTLTFPDYDEFPYRIMFVEQPGYEHNTGIARMYAYRVAKKNIINYLEGHNPYVTPPEGGYDLLYVDTTPNIIARAVTKFAKKNNIPSIPLGTNEAKSQPTKYKPRDYSTHQEIG